MSSEIARHSVHTLMFRSLKRTHDTFIADHGCMPEPEKTRDLVIPVYLKKNTENFNGKYKVYW